MVVWVVFTPLDDLVCNAHVLQEYDFSLWRRGSTLCKLFFYPPYQFLVVGKDRARRLVTTAPRGLHSSVLKKTHKLGSDVLCNHRRT